MINHRFRSDFTPIKQRDFAASLRVSMRMCKGIISRHSWTDPVYHYFDLNAGTGMDDEEEGSPVIFLRLALQEGIPFRAWFFERPKRARKLAHVLEGFCRDHPGLPGTFSIVPGDHRLMLPPILGSFASHPRRVFGLVYSDPSGQAPFGLIRRFSGIPCFERTDFLIYVNGTIYKRCVKSLCHPGHSRIVEHLLSLRKRKVHVRDHLGPWQWSFALCTNSTQFPELRGNGFFDVESDEGRAILTKINLTNEELEAIGFERPRRIVQTRLFD